MADACVYLMNLPLTLMRMLGSDETVMVSLSRLCEHCVGEDVTIGELAALVKKAVGLMAKSFLILKTG